jgi:hypothetical protein
MLHDNKENLQEENTFNRTKRSKTLQEKSTLSSDNSWSVSTPERKRKSSLPTRIAERIESALHNKQLSTSLDENSQDFLWPAWLDPGGKLSMQNPYQTVFQELLSPREEDEQNEDGIHFELGDLVQDEDISSLKYGRAIRSANGWRRDKSGQRIPNKFWMFSGEEKPTDPRGPSYFDDMLSLWPSFEE